MSNCKMFPKSLVEKTARYEGGLDTGEDLWYNGIVESPEE